MSSPGRMANSRRHPFQLVLVRFLLESGVYALLLLAWRTGTQTGPTLEDNWGYGDDIGVTVLIGGLISLAVGMILQRKLAKLTPFRRVLLLCCASLAFAAITGLVAHGLLELEVGVDNVGKPSRTAALSVFFAVEATRAVRWSIFMAIRWLFPSDRTSTLRRNDSPRLRSGDLT